MNSKKHHTLCPDHGLLRANASSKVLVVGIMLLVSIITLAHFTTATPAGPTITYVSNSTYTAPVANRSQDAKGTITVVTMSANQQDYKWKAYVGNVSGGLALDDANSKSIYAWQLATITGEVYATRASGTVNWVNVSCVSQAVIDSEQSALGILSTASDSINTTFNATIHKSFLVGTKNITNSTCRSTATYINSAAQSLTENAFFQEVLLKDDITSSLIYSTLINNDHTSYDGTSTYDFQMIIAENESSSTPTPYYFYVELG